jgi:hypothetical protein
VVPSEVHQCRLGKRRHGAAKVVTRWMPVQLVVRKVSIDAVRVRLRLPTKWREMVL